MIMRTASFAGKVRAHILPCRVGQISLAFLSRGLGILPWCVFEIWVVVRHWSRVGNCVPNAMECEVPNKNHSSDPLCHRLRVHSNTQEAVKVKKHLEEKLPN